MSVEEMIRLHPGASAGTADELIRCIEECLACGESCTSCADACLAEDDVASLRRCIRTNLDCADICHATARIATRLSGGQPASLGALLEVCADECLRCAEECDLHAHHHEHCRVCAAACRSCEQACRAAIEAI